MGQWDDLEDVGQSILDVTATESLLRGEFGPGDIPPGFDGVAELIAKAQGPATPDELVGRAAAMMAFAPRARESVVVRARPSRPLRPLRFPAKVLAVAAPVLLFVTGVAAA